MIYDLCQQETVGGFSDELALKTWLENRARSYELKYLLAHVDDGVIWGHFLEDYTLKIASEVFSQFPILHPKTLQQCRVFGENAEVLLWHTDEEWVWRSLDLRQGVELIEERPILAGIYKRFWVSATNCDLEAIEEKSLLLGTQIKTEKNGFTLLADGQQGLEHAVPQTVNPAVFDKNEPNKKRPVRLVIHHYLEYDDAGVARICLSRLVTIITN